VSHKGLQSFCSLPATNDLLADPFSNGPALEPLLSQTSKALSKTIKAKPRSELQDDNEQRTAQVHTKEHGLRPILELKPSTSSLHRSKSQPTESKTGAIATGLGSSDDTLLPKPQRKLSMQAQKDQGHSQAAIKENIISSTTSTAALETPPLSLPATELYSDLAKAKPLVVQKSQIVLDPTPNPGDQTTHHRRSSEGTSKPGHVTLNNDDQIFPDPRKLGHLISPFLDEGEGPQFPADLKTLKQL
jgi:hypothetical protein